MEEETSRGIDVYYQLIAGERRLRASQLAGLPHVPVVVRNDFEDKGAKLEVALVENLQRKDLNTIERAEAYKKLVDMLDARMNIVIAILLNGIILWDIKMMQKPRKISFWWSLTWFSIFDNILILYGTYKGNRVYPVG